MLNTPAESFSSCRETSIFMTRLSPENQAPIYNDLDHERSRSWFVNI